MQLLIVNIVIYNVNCDIKNVLYNIKVRSHDRQYSLDTPPVQVNINGVKEPCSVLVML